MQPRPDPGKGFPTAPGLSPVFHGIASCAASLSWGFSPSLIHDCKEPSLQVMRPKSATSPGPGCSWRNLFRARSPSDRAAGRQKASPSPQIETQRADSARLRNIKKLKNNVLAMWPCNVSYTPALTCRPAESVHICRLNCDSATLGNRRNPFPAYGWEVDETKRLPRKR